ncbi:hypothetical protein [Chitinolyticbacter meiyuanensis]|uniref:hypothetical protein n=1 Tax=Chitinolyticbacter meiyuanensis TaxID=682798 RepID=UPI0011E5D3A2|nr:hypothetical protein [Chitinolyticbacter meiyuanensis]
MLNVTSNFDNARHAVGFVCFDATIAESPTLPDVDAACCAASISGRVLASHCESGRSDDFTRPALSIHSVRA